MLELTYLHLFLIIAFIISFVAFVFITHGNRPMSNILAWLFFIFLVPYIGIPLFIIIGQRKFAWTLRKKRKISAQNLSGCTANTPVESLLNSFHAIPTCHNKITLLTDGVLAYNTLIEQIKQAKHSICISTYILTRDVVGKQVIDLLTERAQAGVQVCLLIDAFGNLFMFPRRDFRAFQKAGGIVHYIMPLFHRPFHGHANLRDHRKIMIFDGQAAIIGGMNIAEHYMGAEANPERWTDIAMLVHGNAVQELVSIFESDWEFAKSKNHNIKKYQRPDFADINYGNSTIQVVASGPDVRGDGLYDGILTAIFSAQKSIYLVTPYFIVDDALQKALLIACRRKINVNIIIPKKSNHPSADLVRSISIRKLAAEGAKIWLYPKMIHAKVMTFDDNVAVLGSANLDIRSLLLNFEISCFIYSKTDIHHIQTWIEKLLPDCSNKLAKRSIWKIWLEDLAQIIKPLL